MLISEKEEADLEELLDMFAMGLGDLDTFNARLQVGGGGWFGVVDGRRRAGRGGGRRRKRT